jgi:hypothetical protein
MGKVMRHSGLNPVFVIIGFRRENRFALNKNNAKNSIFENI